MSNAEKLAALNSYRAAEGKDPFKDFRPARHQSMLDEYEARADEQADAAIEDANNAPDSMNQDDEIEAMRERQEADAEMQRIEAIKAATKLPSYKTIARYEHSLVESPVAFVHGFLDANPEMTRKQAVSALVQVHGINYSTARTQFQKWFSKHKA